MILKLENKINDLKAVVHTLVEKAKKINFIKGDSQKPTDALNKIKEKIDGLIEISKGSEIIPDDYDNKISKYKDIINKSFKDNNIKNIFLTKLNKAVPDNYDGSNYKLSNLDVELLAKLKELAIAKIDNMNNLDEIKKKAHKAKINGINSPSDLNAYQVNVIDAIDNFIVEAYKENYKIFIDKLAYPLDAENAAKSSSTKAKLKDKYVSNITKSTNINELEQNLNNFKKKVDDVKEIIASISDTIEQNKIAIKNFNKQFSGFNQEKQLDNLKKLVDNYIKISTKFSEFSPYVGTPSDDLAAANKSLEALKAKLWEELPRLIQKLYKIN
ncbi:hypothetical protein [Mycoplasmopsis cynos]|uniref:hypothetical protein n=1 Tax=Mycoplasmopsis cynos TaxID=171284 RepID=UPI00220EBEED|nr:hypothetical protein [Mycoplasmopsis cynos]UWV92427.1 hypothetical protein NWE57_06255 [Mycoplasmopsis cynos]